MLTVTTDKPELAAKFVPYMRSVLNHPIFEMALTELYECYLQYDGMMGDSQEAVTRARAKWELMELEGYDADA